MDVPRRRLTPPPWVREAWVDVWPAFLWSRLLILLAAACAATLYGTAYEGVLRGEPLPWLAPFDGWPGERTWEFLLTPLARYDAVWYLGIAKEGYSPPAIAGNPGEKYAFFPLYPVLVRALSVTGSASGTLIAAHVVSLASFLASLLMLHRLTTIELGPRFARAAVLLLAFSPAAYFFSAPYTESLFLALSLGAVLSARTGHWGWAIALAALSTATRNTGVLLLVPLALLYLYGPRGDREPDREGGGLRPRYALRPDVLLLALVPAGIVAFSLYLSQYASDALAWRNSQSAFGRLETVTPFEGAWRGLEAGARALVDFGANQYDLQNIVNLGFLLLAAVAVVGCLRHLNAAYAGYLAAGIALPLAAPAVDEPLRTMPRFLLVLFPLWMWLAWVAVRRGWVERIVGGSIGLLVLLTAAFATWRPWV